MRFSAHSETENRLDGRSKRVFAAAAAAGVLWMAPSPPAVVNSLPTAVLGAFLVGVGVIYGMHFVFPVHFACQMSLSMQCVH